MTAGTDGVSRRVPWSLVWHHLLEHPARTFLTMAAVAVATLLACFIASVPATMAEAIRASNAARLMTQSAVSLFVALPLSYQEKIANVPGVATVSKMQWFGGEYRGPENFFAQFAVDHDRFFDVYKRDVEMVAAGGAAAAPGMSAPELRRAALAAFAAERRGAIIGDALAREFGWKIGDTIPITPTIFPRTDGEAWEFVVVGIYRALQANVDERTMFFRFDYLDEMLAARMALGPRGCGLFICALEDGETAENVGPRIDALFAAGPQVTRTMTEAAFQAGFVEMQGNLPVFFGTIGSAVLAAVLFSVVNTMLLAARQRIRSTGILKALGFSNGVAALLVLAESLVITVTGGVLGTASALALAPLFRMSPFAAQLPNFGIPASIAGLGLALAAAIGIAGGVAPAVMLYRMRPVAALRSEE